MKKVLGLLFVLVILLTSAVGTGIAETDETTVDREALIGTWVFTIADDSGEEGFLVLNEDETCLLGTGDLMYDMNWTLDGNVLSFVLPDIGIESYYMIVSIDGDTLTLTDDYGTVVELKQMNELPEPISVELGSEAKIFLGEWDLYTPYDATPTRLAFREDGITDISMDFDGDIVNVHTRWNYADGILFFPGTGMYKTAIGEGDGNLQVFFEGERIVLIEEITLLVKEATIYDLATDQVIGFPTRYVNVLTRPDNPLTEEEFQTLQEKYTAVPEAESDAAE